MIGSDSTSSASWNSGLAIRSSRQHLTNMRCSWPIRPGCDPLTCRDKLALSWRAIRKFSRPVRTIARKREAGYIGRRGNAMAVLETRPEGRDYMRRDGDSNRAEQNRIIDKIVEEAVSKELDGEKLRKLLQSKGSRIRDLTEYGRVVHAEMEALLSCTAERAAHGRARRFTAPLSPVTIAPSTLSLLEFLG